MALPFALMLSMQAAGMIVDYLGTKNQQEMMNLGNKLNEAGLESNIEQTRLESEQASLAAMKNLRQTIGSQIATFAARGTALGAGSALSTINESFSNFNADERVRSLNAMGKENQLRSGSAINRLNNMTENSKLWTGFSSRTFNRFPTSLSGWKQGIEDFNEGFGLTRKGS